MNPIFPILIVSFLIGALLLALWRIRTLEKELEQRRDRPTETNS